MVADFARTSKKNKTLEYKVPPDFSNGWKKKESLIIVFFILLFLVTAETFLFC